MRHFIFAMLASLATVGVAGAQTKSPVVGGDNRSDIGAQIMSAIGGLPIQAGYAAGTVVILPGTYVQSTQVSVTSPFVSIVSRDPTGAVQITCSATLGTTPCWKIGTAPFSVLKAGTFGGFTLIGPGPSVSGAVGIQAGAITAAAFRDIVVRGFTGSSAVGMLWSNPPSTWSERVVIDGVHLNGNAIDLKFEGMNGTGDYFYWNVENLQLNIPSGGIGVDLENECEVIGGFWNIVANTNVTNRMPPATVFLVNGTSMFGSDTSLTAASPLVNTVHITLDSSNLKQPVTFWNVAPRAKVNISGIVEGSDNAVYINKISGKFLNWIADTFAGGSTPNYTDLAVLAHGPNGNPANVYILHFENPASSSTLSINNPGNSAFVFDSANQTLSNKILQSPAISSHLDQSATSQFAGSSSCSAGTRTVTFGSAFAYTPVILVFDETTKGGINLTAKSTSSFSVSCAGAGDAFDWIAVGNPY